MKSNFISKKILGCALLSLVLASSNVLTVFNGFNYKNQENQIFAASDYDYCYGSADAELVYLNSDVNLSSKVYYTCRCYEDGTKVLSSIDEVVSKLDGNSCKYYWWQDKFTYILSSDGTKATIRVFGELYNKITCEYKYMVKEFSIAL